MSPLDQMMFLQPGDSVVLDCDFSTANMLASQYVSRPFALEKLAANQTRITLHNDNEHRDIFKIVSIVALLVIAFILITRS
jgi:hypothetical protein